LLVDEEPHARVLPDEIPNSPAAPRDAPGIAYSLLAREAPLESGSVDEAIATGYPCRRWGRVAAGVGSRWTP